MTRHPLILLAVSLCACQRGEIVAALQSPFQGMVEPTAVPLMVGDAPFPDDPSGFAFVTQSGEDCDDGTSRIKEKRIELCDGLRNDCSDERWENDDGIVTWFKADGSHEDLTPLFTSGTPGDPADVRIDEPGVVQICTGDYFVRLELQADAAVLGLDGQNKVHLRGGGTSTVAVIRTSDIHVRLGGITFEDGDSEFTLPGATSHVPFGGALHCNAASLLEVDDCTFDNNSTGKFGAAMGIAGGCHLISTHTTFSNNDAQHAGSAVAVTGGTASFSDGFINGNDCSALNGGGAIFAGQDAVVTLERMEFAHNTAPYGGAMLAASLADLSGQQDPMVAADDCTFSNNTVSKTGAAVEVRHGDVLISHSTFHGNRAGQKGGGVYLEGASSRLTLTDATFTDNEATWHGAAIATDGGSLLVQDTTFEDNVAGRRGGAAWITDGDATFDLVTFSGNEADPDYDGGAIFLRNASVDIIDGAFEANAPEDVFIGNSAQSYSWSSPTTVSCDVESCR